jgi:hypothetical protein
MSLEEFQRATSDLIASPALCRQLQRDPQTVLNQYQLSTRDQRRLVDMVGQPGMSVNCTLYRFNRITPVYTLLPLTCFVLGDRFIPEAETFWETFQDSDPRFRNEIARFGDFLTRRLNDGSLENPLLKEVLAFELATNDLRFAQRQTILEGLPAQSQDHEGPLQLHPLVRLVEFHHEPTKLLELLRNRAPLPYDLQRREFWVLLDVLDEELQVRRIDARVGRLLEAISLGEQPDLEVEDVSALLDAGMIVISR